MRIEDILSLHLCDIVKDGANYRLDIIEHKTKKKRTFIVPLQVYQFIYMYCVENNIVKTDIIFPITERAVQKHLKKVIPENVEVITCHMGLSAKFNFVGIR